MPKNRISTSYKFQRIFVTLLYCVVIVSLVNDFSLIALIFATIILVSFWLFTYQATKVEFDQSFMYVKQFGTKCTVGLESIWDIGIAGSFGRQKYYCVKYFNGGKLCSVKFSGRILLTDFEEFCKAVRDKNPMVHIELPYPLDNC